MPKKHALQKKGSLGQLSQESDAQTSSWGTSPLNKEPENSTTSAIALWGQTRYLQGQLDFIDQDMPYVISLLYAWLDVNTAISIICQLTFCNNGPDTRAALRDSVADLMRTAKELDLTIKQVNASSASEVLYEAISLINNNAVRVDDLRKQCDAFLVTDENTDAKFKTLNTYIVRQSPEMLALSQKIAGMLTHKGPRGRGRKDNEWLTVEIARRVDSGYSVPNAVSEVRRLLEERQDSHSATEDEKQALKELNSFSDEVGTMSRRLTRRRKSG